MTRLLVAGAGGFIGHHLVSIVRQRGYWGRGADLTEPEYTGVDTDEFEFLDSCRPDAALGATRDTDGVHALAAEIGGVGFIPPYMHRCSGTTR